MLVLAYIGLCWRQESDSSSDSVRPIDKLIKYFHLKEYDVHQFNKGFTVMGNIQFNDLLFRFFSPLRRLALF